MFIWPLRQACLLNIYVYGVAVSNAISRIWITAKFYPTTATTYSYVDCPLGGDLTTNRKHTVTNFRNNK